MAKTQPMTAKAFRNSCWLSCWLILILPIAMVGGCQQAQPNRTATARDGMVVSAHDLASRVGVELLRSGGNAVDAAVGVGFALAVVYPEAGNLGGGGFMVIRFPDNSSTAIDFRETAPGAARRDMYLDENGEFIPQKSQRGYLAAGVPGTVKGLALAHEKYGLLSWERVIEPAIALAEKGFDLTEKQAAALQKVGEAFPSSNKVFGKALSNFRAKQNFRQPELAQTLRAVQQEGEQGFYTGAVADLIVQDMARNGGLINLADLAGYRAVEREPLTAVYRDFDLILMPPPSSGGIALIEMLNILEFYDLAGPGPQYAETVRLIIEAMRLAFADRAHFLGDPDFVDIPVQKLIAKSYAAELRGKIPAFGAGHSEESAEIPAAMQGEARETTHYSVADRSGLAVAVTTTLNGSFGSLAVVDGAGFLLNNEMDDFTAKPGAANMFGLIQGEANAIQPHKRMLSSMTPTIVCRQGQLHSVVGSPGGPTIITTVLHVLLHTLDYGKNIEEAIAAPRFHHQWLPDVVEYERDRFDDDLIAGLQEWGYQLRSTGVLGQVHGLSWDPSAQNFYGAADPRGDGSARGFTADGK